MTEFKIKKDGFPPSVVQCPVATHGVGLGYRVWVTELGLQVSDFSVGKVLIEVYRVKFLPSRHGGVRLKLHPSSASDMTLKPCTEGFRRGRR